VRLRAEERGVQLGADHASEYRARPTADGEQVDELS
jgi:hypothetical protein